MERIEVRTVIIYLCLKNLTIEQFHLDLQETLDVHVPFYPLVARWCTEFKRKRTSTNNDSCSGRPNTVVTEQVKKKIYENNFKGSSC